MNEETSGIRQGLAAARHTEEKQYWLRTLSGELTRSGFPHDYNRSVAVAAGSVGRELPPGVVRRLLKLSGGADVRLFIALTAGLFVLLNKYTHNDDLIVGTSVYRQKDGHLATQTLINKILPLRTRLHGTVTFKELLVGTAAVLMGANRNRNYPMRHLLPLLDLADPGDGAPSKDFPLFDTAIVLDNIHDPAYLEDTRCSTLFCFHREGEGLHLSVRYDGQRFSPDTIGRIIDHYINLLTGLLHDPDRAVRGAAVLSERERERILYDFNRTDGDYPRDQTLHRLFMEQAEKKPGNIAVSDGDRTVTYGELDRRTGVLAQRLRQGGLRPNHFAAVLMDRSVHMITAVMAILKAGGAYVPLEPHLPDQRIITCLSPLGIQNLLTPLSQLDKMKRIAARLPHVPNIFFPAGHTWEREGGEAEGGDTGASQTEATATDIAYIIFTSGTTGVPKGVVVRHRPVINIIHWVNRTFDVCENDRLLFVVSLSFDLSVYDIFGILAGGGMVRVADSDETQSPQRLLRIIREEGITFWDSAPAALQLLEPYLENVRENVRENDGAKDRERASLRLVFLSGDWVPITLPGVLQGAFPGVRVIALGGATEAVIWSNHFPVTGVDPDWVSIPYGKPTSNARYYILDSHLAPCPFDVPGDLYIGGECLAMGYINDPELTAGKFVRNPFRPGERMYRTGDLARLHPDGTIEFLGRRDSQVKIRGYRIEIGEIEARLLKHPLVKGAVVVARGEKGSGKYLCGYYVSERPEDAGDLTDHLSGALPAYMVPSHLVRLDSIPLTANGKVDRKRLPAPPLSPGGQGCRYAPPGDETEETLVKIWSEILGIEAERIGIDANFFDIGGHSLTATQLVSLIHRDLNVLPPLTEIFKGPTIRDIAAFIRTGGGDTFVTLGVTLNALEEQEYYPASSAQQRLYFHQQMDPESVVYNISGLMPTDPGGPDTPPADGAHGDAYRRVKGALEQLIHRHESLRTSFTVIDGRVVQRVHATAPLELEAYTTTPRGVRDIMEQFIRPFPPDRAPLFRAALIETGTETGKDVPNNPNNRYLAVDMHHIIADGVSENLLFSEFSRLYHGEVLSPPPAVQYKEFAHWQHRFAASEQMKAQLGYWRDLLSDLPPRMNLPTDHPRPAMLSFAGDEITFTIGADLRDKIRELEKGGGVTLFMVLLAAFNILLMKYSGQEDILVGFPTAGRRHADLHGVVGMFVNLLVMRNRPGGLKSVREFLDEVRQNALRAFENQDVQLEQLTGHLGLKADPSRNPLFDVCFFLQNFMDPAFTDSGPPAPTDHFTKKVTQFDLELGAYETAGGIYFFLKYSTALFTKATVETYAHRYVEILEQVATAPDRKLKDIALTHRLTALRPKSLREATGDFGI